MGMLRGGQIKYEVYKSVTKYTALGFKYTEVVSPTNPDWNTYVKVRVPMSLWRYGRSMFAIGILINFFKAFKYVEASKHLSAFSKTISAAIVPCLILFVTYSIITMFVLMTMFLKLIDVAYGGVMDGINDNDEDDFRELCIAAMKHLVEQHRLTQMSQRFLSKGKRLFKKMKAEVHPEEIEKKMMQFARTVVVEDATEGVKIKERPTEEELEEQYAAELEGMSHVDRELERMKRKKRGTTTMEEERAARRMIVRKYVRNNDFSKLEEKDIEEEDLMERLHLVQHRYTILIKLASRLQNSVEAYTPMPEHHEEAKKIATEAPEMKNMRELLGKKKADDMRIDYMETPQPEQHKLPDIPPDNVRLDNKITEQPKDKTGKGQPKDKAPVAPPHRELRQDEQAAALASNMTLKGYASMTELPGQVAPSASLDKDGSDEDD